MKPAAFQATFSDFRIVKGRKCAQLVFEVPLEGADAALTALGGVPRPDKEAWVAVARIDPKALSEPPKPSDEPKERREWSSISLAQQAGIRCNEEAFAKFVYERHSFPGHPADFVRSHCGVQSRSDLSLDNAAGARWLKLNREFEVWKIEAEHI